MVNDIDPATNAFWIANDMEKKRYQYDLKPNELVIDLGGHEGLFAIEIYNKYQVRVIVVEPTGAANWLQSAYGIEVIQKAASVDYEALQFGGQSYYTSAAEVGDTVYPCFDVLDLMTDDIALMKINIEGMEYAVLKHIIDHDRAHMVRNFQIQFHHINEMSEVAYAHLNAQLGKTHKLDWRVPFCWESWSKK